MSGEPKRNWLGGIYLVVILLCLFLFYPLSIGPVIWFAERDYFSDATYDMFESIYAPLVWVGDYWPSAGRALDAYAAFWEP